MTPWPVRLSPRQMVIMVFMVTLCVTPFGYASNILRALHRLAWVALVPALGVGLAGLATALALVARFQNESIVSYAPRVLGPLLGRLYLLVLGVLLFTGAPGMTRVLTHVVRFTELPHSSLYLPAVILIGVVAYAAYFGPEVIMRVGEIMAIPVVVGFMFIFFAPLATSLPERLLPLHAFAWAGYFTPSVSSSLGTVRGFLCVLVLGGTVRGGGRTFGRAAYAAMAAAWVLLALSLALPVMVLGSGLSEVLRYPLLGVTGTITFRWFPFQRLTLVTILVWQLVMYVVLGFYLWSGAYVLAAALGIKHWRVLVLPCAIAAVVLGSMTLDPRLSQDMMNGWDFAVDAFGVLAPAALVLIARMRRLKAAAPA